MKVMIFIIFRDFFEFFMNLILFILNYNESKIIFLSRIDAIADVV